MRIARPSASIGRHRHAVPLGASAAGRLNAPRLFSRDGSKIDRPALDCHACVGAREDEQAIDEPAHAPGLAHDIGDRCGSIRGGGVRVLAQELRVRADRRQRRAELV